MKIYILHLILLAPLWLWAQIEPTPQKTKLSISGTIESYYAYDFNKPEGKNRPDFMYSHARHNEFNVNLALLQANMNADRFRGTIGLMAGSFAQKNMAHEWPVMQHIYEAQAGLRLVDNLWLDAGIFSSHIGFEAAISPKNWTLTRSILAEESPYYLAGAKLSYVLKEKWTFLLVLCNGWQNILETNTNKALGLQVAYTPQENIAINYSNFFSNEMPDDSVQWRLFHNFYTTLKIKKLGFSFGFDLGMQENELQNDWELWLSPILIGHYTFSEQWQLAARAEYFQDLQGVLKQADFSTFGFSLNGDYFPMKWVSLRLEARYFYSPEPIFTRNNASVQDNFSITSALTISF